MTFVFVVLLVGNIILSLVLFWQFRIERRRNRILQAFVAGIVRSISDYFSVNDAVEPSEVPEQNTKLPIPYKKVLESIEYEFQKDFWVEPYQKWLKDDRQIFADAKYANDGFNFIYYDLFDKLAKQWMSGELLSEKEKAFLREDIVVNKDNVGELQGEIGMFKDLLAGKLDANNLKKETIDNQLLFMFNHIKIERREELKKEVLKRIK